ncbi:MAG TPA: DUF6588 family protein [Bacteroidota bacterium]|nr:DUF6588 family protein [Bacteroidota bacterium]
MKLFCTLCIAFAVVCAVGVASGQDDLGKQLGKIAGENAKGYLTPFLSPIGAGFNSGFYHSAELHGVLGFDIGVKAALITLGDEDKVFDFVLPSTISYSSGTGPSATLTAGADYDQIVTGAPTAVGAKVGKEVKVKQTSSQVALRGQTIFTTPQGFDLSGVAVIVPQASIGLPLGLEVTGRFMPTLKLGDVGKLNVMGFGLRHDIDQYIPLLPLDIAVHFATQKMTMSDNSDKDIMSLSATAFGAEVSKKLLFITVYGGFQIESSTWTVEPYRYTDLSTNATVEIKGLEVKGKNKSRFHVGARMLLLFVNVHADYSFSTHPVLTAGVGISFR